MSRKNEDNENPIMDTVLDSEVPTLEVKSNYVNTSVMLPILNTYDRGKVIGRKRDADGNFVGRRNDKSILDTREYCVYFDDEEVRKRTASLITESMYEAFDDFVNEYLMVDSIVGYQKNDKAIRVPDDNVVHRGQRLVRISTVGCQLCVHGDMVQRYFSHSSI